MEIIRVCESNNKFYSSKIGKYIPKKYLITLIKNKTPFRVVRARDNADITLLVITNLQTKTGELELIKKYKNRKMYSITRGSYITYDDISTLIATNQKFKVVDSTTLKDLTMEVRLKMAYYRELKKIKENQEGIQ